MQVSEQIIEVLDYLAEKLGIAINWGADNIVPYVQDVMNRYRLYAITSNAIWLGISIILFIVMFALISKLKKNRQKWYNDDDYDYDDIVWFTGLWIAGIIILGIVALALFCINLSSLLRWCFIPEVEFLNLVKDLISN